MVARDLIHRRTRHAFREACSDLAVIRMIQQAFENEGFDPAPEFAAPGGNWDAPGQRRGTFDRYTHAVDWGDSAQVKRLLHVFEEILTWGDGDYAERTREQLRRHLERDGFVVNDKGRILPSTAGVLEELPLANLRDAGAILEHLDRIAGSMDSDPALAISGAKALIEATAKKVLEELGEDFDERADVPELVKAAQKALQLHRDSVAPSAAGSETIKRILSSLTQIAIGVAELRNEYGPDHGRSKPTSGLQPRHAHLAVGAASTYCRMLLGTLGDRRSKQL